MQAHLQILRKYYANIMSKGASPELPLTVSLQSGRVAEPGVLLPAALLRPLQTGHHRLDAAVSARPRSEHVRTHRHDLTSAPPPRSGSRVRLLQWFWTKSKSVFIYFSNGLAPCEERPRYQKLGNTKILVDTV